MNKKLKDVIVSADRPFKELVAIGMGAIFLDKCGMPHILAQTGMGEFNFVSLRDGNRMTNPAKISRSGCHSGFTREELHLIAGGDRIEEWTLLRPGKSNCSNDDLYGWVKDATNG